MRIGIDVDGVLCDHVRGLEPWISRRYGVQFTKEMVTDWDFDFGPSSLVKELREAYSHPEVIQMLPAVPGARAAIEALRQKHELLAVSNRPRVAEAATREWLDREIGPINLLLFSGSKLLSRVDLLIDDFPPHVVELATQRKLGILFTQPWNQAFEIPARGPRSKRIARALDWGGAVELADSVSPDGLFLPPSTSYRIPSLAIR